jgi:RHS repeat-associated protein
LTSNTGGASDLDLSYAYDGNGLLQSSTSSGTTTQLTWDTTASVPLLIVDGSTSIIYGPGNLPLEQIGPGDTAVYYHHDSLGSTRLLTNESGGGLETVNYSPYGTPTIASGTALTNLLFDGQYTDPSDGLIYMRARWYDPVTGQFLSVDPAESQTGAAYYYASDNPVSDDDLTGDASTGATGANGPTGPAPCSKYKSGPKSCAEVFGSGSQPWYEEAAGLAIVAVLGLDGPDEVVAGASVADGVDAAVNAVGDVIDGADSEASAGQSQAVRAWTRFSSSRAGQYKDLADRIQHGFDVFQAWRISQPPNSLTGAALNLAEHAFRLFGL